MANEVTITVKGREQGAKQAVEGVSSSVQRMGDVAQGIIAAQLFQKIGESAQRFMGNAKVAASNLGESVNAMQVVFKGATPALLEVGKAASTSMGLSQRAFNDASVRFSNFAKAVAGEGGNVTKVITDITQRSSDFASVMNLDVEQAMQVFQSGLAGESEPLRRYGIDVSAAAVQTFAYANGIAAAGAELTEAQKVQARYGLIMQQTEEMAGDFTNTAGSLANQQRILNAEMENAQATMGQAVVPAFQLLNSVLIPTLQAFQALPGPVQTVVSVLILLGAGILTVTSRIAPMIISMNAAGVSAATMATKFRAMSVAMGPIGIIFGALAFAVAKGTQEFQAAEVEAGKLAEDLERLAKTGRETGVVSELMSRDLEHFGSTLEAVAADAKSNWADRNFIWSPAKRKEVNQAVEDIGALDEALTQIVESGGNGEDALLAYAEANGLSAEEVERLRGFLPEFTEAMQRAGEETQDAADAALAHAGALDTLAEKLRAQTDPLFKFIKANEDADEAQRNLTEAEETFGKGSPEYERALLDLAEANLNLFGATTDASGEIDGSLIPALTRARGAGIITDKEFEALVEQIKILDRTDANITVKDNAAQAQRRFENMRRRLQNINRFVTYTFQTQGSAPVGSFKVPTAHGGISGGPRGMQDGGISGDGRSEVLVNEQGPELARLPSGDVVSLPLGSTVIPAGQSAAMMDRAGRGPTGQHERVLPPGGGGVMEVRIVGSGDALLDAIIKSLSFRVRTEGGGSVDVLLGGAR